MGLFTTAIVVTGALQIFKKICDCHKPPMRGPGYFGGMYGGIYGGIYGNSIYGPYLNNYGYNCSPPICAGPKITSPSIMNDFFNSAPVSAKGKWC